jgi:hypothetical protein
VLDQPDRKWKQAAFTDQPVRGNWDQGGSVVGRSMRTDRYRYTAWIDRASGSVAARQLFDLQADPLETNNLAADSRHAELVERLQRALTSGWQEASGPAQEFVAQNTAAASGPPEPGIRNDFESLTAGPFTNLSNASWEAAEGHAVIDTSHSRSGLQSLRLPGGKDRQAVWTPTESKTTPDRLSFWFERRTPGRARIRASGSSTNRFAIR